MKKLQLLMLIWGLAAAFGWGQPLEKDLYSFSLNGHEITPGLSNAKTVKPTNPGKPTAGANYRIVQFHAIPSLEEKKQLEAKGIKLLDYVQGNAYYAEVPANMYRLKSRDLKSIRSLVEIKPEYKIERNIAANNIPDYARAGGDLIKVVVTCFDGCGEPVFYRNLKSLGATNIKPLQYFGTIHAEVPHRNIHELASLHWVQNVQLTAPPHVVQNREAGTSHRANVLRSNLRGLGYGLTGRGVKIGFWDEDVERHRDFGDRVTRREFEAHYTGHGTHTSGTAVGSGVIDPRAQGMAPEATVYSWNCNIQSNGLTEAEERLISLEEDGIEITSNSYTTLVRECPNKYAYNSEDHDDDLLSNAYPYFLYVYGVGNYRQVCPYGYRTTSCNVKNSLIVAANDDLDRITSFSSAGPSYDGRLYPNISGVGTKVYSATFSNLYRSINGTSMSTPGVAGTMALIYQRYKDNHGGGRPLSSLMRAIACNTAKDCGNPGPDYKFGYGRINGMRGVEVLEKNTWFTGSVRNGETVEKDITLPEGAIALKVMLAWTDPEATPGAERILINNLDLKVTKGSDEFLPWVLDPENPSANAVRGIDDLNNMEQVTISKPVAGKYTLSVRGKEVPKGVQDYAVVYEVVMPTFKLTYPIEREKLIPGEKEIIHWECRGYTTPVTIEYSSDNGANYEVLATNIPAGQEGYEWTVPEERAAYARIRISSGSALDESKAFTIMEIPENIGIEGTESIPCGSSGPFRLTWNTITGAKYEVLKLNGEKFEVFGYSDTNTFEIKGLTGQDNYFSVRAVDKATGAVSGRRFGAEIKLPRDGGVSVPYVDRFKLDTVRPYYFLTKKGKGKIFYVYTMNRYAIYLWGAGDISGWTDATGEECFNANPDYVCTAGICSMDASTYKEKSLRLSFDFLQQVSVNPGTNYFRVKVNGNPVPDLYGVTVHGDSLLGSVRRLYYDLSAWIGEPSITLEFEAVCKQGRGRHIDNAVISNIEIVGPEQVDPEMLSVKVTDGGTDKEQVTVEIKNVGLTAITDIPVSYKVNGANEVNEVIPGPLAPMQKILYLFKQTADLSREGKYEVVASVSVPEDSVTGNNQKSTLKYTDRTLKMGEISGIVDTCGVKFTDSGGLYKPYGQGENSTVTFRPENPTDAIKVSFSEFKTQQYGTLTIYEGATTDYSNLMARLSGSDLPPSYTSSVTGGELTFNFSSNKYREADSGWVANIECVSRLKKDIQLVEILTPKEESGGKTQPERVNFRVENKGYDTITSYKAYYRVNDNPPVSQEFNAVLAAGESERSGFDSLADFTELGEYELQVWVEVQGDTVNDNADTIQFESLTHFKDLGVANIVSALPARKKHTTLEVEVENYGNVTVNNFDIAYRVNGGEEVTETFSRPIPAGSFDNFTLKEPVDLTALGEERKIEVYTKFADDEDPDNNTKVMNILPADFPETNVLAEYDGGRRVRAVANSSQGIDLINNYSVECWINLSDEMLNGDIFNKGKINLNYKVNGDMSDLTLTVTTEQGELTSSALKSIKLNEWHHLALTVSEDNQYKLFIDGENKEWDEINGTQAATSSNIYNRLSIGNGRNTYRAISGKIDEFRVWDKCLEPSTIADNLMTDYEAETPGLLAYYKFNEGSGPYVFDYSVNDNTALVYGADVSGTGEGKFWNEQNGLMESYSIDGEMVPAIYDAGANTYNVVVDKEDLTSLIASFKPAQQSEVKIGNVVQESGVTANDFSDGPLHYTVEGVGFNKGIKQEFNVSTYGPEYLENELSSFSFKALDNPELSEDITLTRVGNNFMSKQPYGIPVSNLKARFIASNYATVLIDGEGQESPQSVAMDYSQPIMVNVVSGSQSNLRNYKVFIDTRNTEAGLFDLILLEETGAIKEIDNENNTIKVWVGGNTDVTSLTPLFAISENARLYLGSIERYNGISREDFTHPKFYSVVSEDEQTSEEWTVSVSKDRSRPSLVLLGEGIITIEKGQRFDDPGATAMDSLEGDISSLIVRTGTVNTNVAGSYTLEYNITDALGNTGETVTRIINVVDHKSGVDELAGSVARVYAFNGTIYVDIPEQQEAGELTVTDILGRTVYNKDKLAQGTTRLEVEFRPGVYVTVLKVNGEVRSERIVIE